MAELIIYDCDGTLIDSERLVAEVCLEAIHGLGLTDWTMDRYVESFVGMPGAVGWGTVKAALGRDFPQGFNAAVDARIDTRFANELTPLPGVRDAIMALTGPRCVASSTAEPFLTTNITTAGLHDLFGDAIFSASRVRRAKPAPDVFLYSASQMGHDPRDCLVIEDSVPGVTAALRAGMTVIGFTGAAHDPATMRARLLAAGARLVVGHMAELPAAARAL